MKKMRNNPATTPKSKPKSLSGHFEGMFALLQESHLPKGEDRDAFCKFLAKYPDNFSNRNNLHGHVTSSALVLNKAHDKIIMVRHEGMKEWMHPGFHWDKTDETCLESALRGVRENIFNFRRHEHRLLKDGKPLLASIFDILDHRHYDLTFLLEMEDDYKVYPGSSFRDAAWVSLEEIEEGGIILHETSEDAMEYLQQSVLAPIEEGKLKSGSKTQISRGRKLAGRRDVQELAA